MSVGPVPLATGLSPAVEAASVPSALITGAPLSWAEAPGLKAMSPALRLRIRMNFVMDSLLGSGVVDGRPPWPHPSALYGRVALQRVRRPRGFLPPPGATPTGWQFARQSP